VSLQQEFLLENLSLDECCLQPALKLFKYLEQGMGYVVAFPSSTHQRQQNLAKLYFLMHRGRKLSQRLWGMAPMSKSNGQLWIGTLVPTNSELDQSPFLSSWCTLLLWEEDKLRVTPGSSNVVHAP